MVSKNWKLYTGWRFNMGQDTVNDVVNIGTQIGTGGLLGYGDDGFEMGYSSKLAYGAAEEPLKEITGAKAAEEANELARKQIEETKAQAEQDRANAQNANAQRQLQLSRSAAATRGGGSIRSTGLMSGNNLGSDERDFLGL